MICSKVEEIYKIYEKEKNPYLLLNPMNYVRTEMHKLYFRIPAVRASIAQSLFTYNIYIFCIFFSFIPINYFRRWRDKNDKDH